jgi:hypothetical protein
MKERHAQLKHLRQWRTRPDRDISIAGTLRDAAANAESLRRKSKGAGESWDNLVPPRIRQRCQVLLVRAGVMTVKVRDAAARFEIDRWLRGGGEQELLRRAGIKRVKVV